VSIVSLSKLSIVTPINSKNAVLDKLQTMGCMHLISLTKQVSQSDALQDIDIEQIQLVIRFLDESGRRRSQTTREQEFNVLAFITRTLELKEKLRLACEEKEKVTKKIELYQPWGDFEFPPVSELKDLKFWFYVLPVNSQDELQAVEFPWQIIRKDNRFIYVIVISKEEPRADLFSIERSHLGESSLAKLKLHLEDINIEIDELNLQREALTKYRYLLSLHLNEAWNRLSMEKAKACTLDTDGTAIIQGWVASHRVTEIEMTLKPFHCALIIESPDPNELPPTLIEQPQPIAAAKYLSLFYQVPNYRSWDPSRLLFVFFSLFFSMILADAGYGLILLLCIFAFRKKLNARENGKSIVLMGAVLSTATIVYGALVGSYFGVSPSSGSVLSYVKVLDLHNFDVMMQLSIIIGALHICLANFFLFLSSHSKSFQLSRAGWIMITLSGVIHWLFFNEETLQILSSVGFGLGIFLVIAFTSSRPIKSSLDFLIRLKEGVFSVANLMSLFGDVLSYMRLFALGLASASLAITFNHLAIDAYNSIPGVGLMLAILIILVGHFLNLCLSLIGGVIHGLRLNFIEFYKWGLPEEGQAFKAFSKKELTR